MEFQGILDYPKYPLEILDDSIELDEISGRCAHIPISSLTYMKLNNSNLSGAFLGLMLESKDDPSKAMTLSISHFEKYSNNFKGNFYFSDNPPLGLNEDVKSKYLQKIDRDDAIQQCKSEFDQDIPAQCASILISPQKCDVKHTLNEFGAPISLFKP